MLRRPAFFRVLPFIALLAACAEPPSKEMNQAQGAIDAARAAGADQYAPTEFTAAVDGLKKSEEAAAQHDYRLALNYAIDSRSRAQEAAKGAVEARAKARGDAERAVAEANTLLGQAVDRLRDPNVSRLPRRTLQEPRRVVEAAQKSMQEAGAALTRDDYSRAITLTEGLSARLQVALAAIDDVVAANPPRRRR